MIGMEQLELFMKFSSLSLLLLLLYAKWNTILKLHQTQCIPLDPSDPLVSQRLS
jgi:hypothetical protein